jgi:hypothetical protein
VRGRDDPSSGGEDLLGRLVGVADSDVHRPCAALYARRRLDHGHRTPPEQAGLQRAADEGFVRSDVPLAWVRTVLDQLVDSIAHRFPEVEPPQAADMVVDAFLHGVGGS